MQAIMQQQNSGKKHPDAHTYASIRPTTAVLSTAFGVGHKVSSTSTGLYNRNDTLEFYHVRIRLIVINSIDFDSVAGQYSLPFANGE